ncbi:MAG TPA: cobalamin-binding protein [Alphaproteobacteria bacterium]|nr:cobalamin-binding protein [Alphaproteobacteria bacterium]
MAHQNPRVASLLASATEIVAGLGATDLLVARSHECDFPPEIAPLPVVTAAQIDTDQPSGAIDREVKALLSRALSIYRVDGERLRTLAPDLILTQTQCEVCAVTPADVEAALAAWTGARPRLVSLAPNALSDIFADIERVAAALGRPQRGAALVDSMRARMDAIATAAEALAARPRVACLEWIDPLMAAGNWVPELVAMAGGDNLFGAAGRHSPWMSLEELAAADPDVVLVLPCGFDIARTRRELPALTGRPEWRALRAVRERRIFLCDGNQYFNRPGPRVADSLEILAEIVHPARFDFGHRGSGWVRLSETAEARP